jgi:hypothetical protein
VCFFRMDTARTFHRNAKKHLKVRRIHYCGQKRASPPSPSQLLLPAPRQSPLDAKRQKTVKFDNKSVGFIHGIFSADFFENPGRATKHDSYVYAIAASTIHMFTRSLPRRFICLRDRCLDDSYVSAIAALTIHMFQRSPPRRFICFRDRCFDDSYVSAIAASTIHMFQRSPPRRFICFRHRPLDDSYVSVIAASTIHMFPRSLP